MTDTLKSKTLSALSWSFIEAILLQGIRFAIGVVLARLLFPEQFGLIGMLTIFMMVAQAFLDGGFGSALIQKQEPSQADICSIFYFNILIGFAAAGLLCLIAPWIAGFYNQPELTSLARVMSIILVVNAFGLIQNTILTKQINFKIQTKVSLIAGILSGILGIGAAVAGFGVWSLVIQQVANTLIRTACLWIYSPWRPSLTFSLTAMRTMFGFGSRMLASNILNQIFSNIYLLVIGKLFSASDLGFFTRAKTLQDLPSQTLTDVVSRVTFPVFSTIQDDVLRLKRGLKKALTVLALVNFPLMIGLAVIARPLVLVLLTEKWAACIPYFQLLCFVGLMFPLHAMNLNILQAVGRSDLFLRLEIIKKILIGIGLALTWRWGIRSIIYGMMAVSIICYYLNSYYNGILIKYPMGEQIRDMFSSFILSVLMGISVYSVGMIPFSSLWFRLLVQICAGIVVYVSLCRIFRIPSFMEIWEAGWTRVSEMRVGSAG